MGTLGVAVIHQNDLLVEGSNGRPWSDFDFHFSSVSVLSFPVPPASSFSFIFIIRQSDGLLWLIFTVRLIHSGLRWNRSLRPVVLSLC